MKLIVASFYVRLMTFATPRQTYIAWQALSDIMIQRNLQLYSQASQRLVGSVPYTNT